VVVLIVLALAAYLVGFGAPGGYPGNYVKYETDVRSMSVLDREGAPFAALAGGVVTVVLSVIPFSPVVGGAVAAVRYGGGYAAGLGVGVLAGIAAAVPLGALLVPAVWFVGYVLGFGVSPSSPAYGVFLAIVAVFFLGYTVGGSAVGGLAGVALDRHTDWDLSGDRWL